LVLAVPGILGAPGVAYTDFSANIKGSGTNKVITANGDAGVAVTASYYGSALSFDGSGDYFSGPTNDSDFQPSSNDFTVECWVNPKTLSANGGFCGIWDYTNNQRSWIFYHGSDGTPYFQVSSNGTSSAYAQSGIALTTNQWSHVVGEKYGNIITVYVNGVATGINTNGPTTIYTNTGDPLIIGDYGSTPADPFNGYIQDLRVYKGVAKYKGGFDVPKPYTPVGIATWRAVPDTTANNFATLNPLNNKGTTLTNGNLTVDTGTTNGNYVNGTIGFPKTGKWYWEYVPTSTGNHTFAGIGTEGESSSAFGRVAYYAANGQKYVDGTASAYGSTYTNNDIIGVAANIDSTAITFYKNGVSQGDISYPPLSGVTTTYLPFFADGAGATGTVINVNFGQNPTFSGNTTAGTFTDSNGKGLFKYEPPSGFLALCEDNLPTPAIKNPGEHFKTVLWTGTGASRNVVGVGFTPDLVWIKDRTGTAGHALHDSVRLPSFRLNSSSTNEESSESSSFISFSSDGFSLAGNDTTYNNTARNYVAWCWKAGAGTTTANTDGTIPSVVSVNQDAGFSIVSWTGTGSAGTIGHNLGKTPAFRIIKYRGTSNWYVWHKALAANEFLILNQTTAKTGSSSLWNNTLPTSSTISYTTATTSDRFIEYVWAEIEGFSKFGSYVGNGNADGPAVYCGFKPALVIFKRTDSTDNWRMNDNARGAANGTNFVLYPNLSNIEDQANDHLDYLSNGFKLRSTNNSNAK
jgi:Tfp pilus assembly protein FimT